MTFLFTLFKSTLKQKSYNDLYFSFSLFSMITEIAFLPTFFMAPNPNLILLSTIVKSKKLSLTSGGKISILRFLHSLMSLMILS